MPGRYALLIANTTYTDPGLAQLEAPGTDAEDFARVLRAEDIGAFDEVKALVDENAPVLGEAIDEFFSLKKPDDLLVLYFSGHGVRDEFGSLYLAVHNTKRARLRSTAIEADFIRKAMDQSRSKRQVLILDCCNSGAFADGTKAETGGSIGTASAFEGTGYGRIVLTATDATQFAWEGDKVIGEASNSLFTHFLVKGLEGDADQDGDGKITVDELYDYAYEQIVTLTPKQTPGKWSYRQQGEIVLRQSSRAADIKPVPLPEEITSAIESSLPYVREGAVEHLAKLLTARNLGLARSAREALERISAEDDSSRVRSAATRALELIREVEQKAEAERLAKAGDEAERRVDAETLPADTAADGAADRKAAETVEPGRVEEITRTEQLRRQQVEQAARFKIEQDRLLAEKAELERQLKAEQERAERISWEPAGVPEQGMREEAGSPEEAELESRPSAEQERAERISWEPGGNPEQAVLEVVESPGAELSTGAQITAGTPQVVVQEMAERDTGIRETDQVAKQLEIAGIVASPSWISLLWIMLGWAIGLAVGWAIGWKLAESGDGSTGWQIGSAIGGAIGGLGIALVLRQELTLSDRNSMLWVIAAWALGGALGDGLSWGISPKLTEELDWVMGWIIAGAIGWAVGGAIGGLGTSMVLRRERILPDLRGMLWVTAGWAMAGAIGTNLGLFITNPDMWLDWISNATIAGVVAGALAGALGGSIMIWQIRKSKV